MATKNAYLVQERIYPLVQLSVGVVFTFGCIGLLAIAFSTHRILIGSICGANRVNTSRRLKS